MDHGPAKPFTGKHMFAILVAFFGVVIAVNFTMARYASSTFGGLMVENSYVASQEFNRWLDEAKAEDALGWDAVATWRPDNRVAVKVTGPTHGAHLAGMARHPLGRLPDVALTFEPIGGGTYLSREALPEGRWTLRLELDAGDHVWRHEEHLQ